MFVLSTVIINGLLVPVTVIVAMNLLLIVAGIVYWIKFRNKFHIPKHTKQVIIGSICVLLLIQILFIIILFMKLLSESTLVA